MVAALALARIPGLGPRSYSALLQGFGSAAGVFTAGDFALRSVLDNERLVRAIRSARPQDMVAADAQWLAADPRHFVLSRGSPGFPATLAEIPDAPVVLWGFGQAAALSGALVAIVGSRNATPAGREHARAFAASLVAAGYGVVSGLALGIDAAAHAGALAAQGATVAVLGTGVDRIYPTEHEELAAGIPARGAIVSEFPPGTGPHPGHFPRRNRVIAGLCRGTLVVEASPRSGALITAQLAADYGREVFAIPGPINSPVARGCHLLLKQGATLVEQIDDILAQLGGWQFEGRGVAVGAADRPGNSGVRPDANSPPVQDAELAQLLGSLDHTPASLDQIVGRSGLTASRVSSMLLMLELEGVVAALPGGQYLRRPPRGS